MIVKSIGFIMIGFVGMYIRLSAQTLTEFCAGLNNKDVKFEVVKAGVSRLNKDKTVTLSTNQIRVRSINLDSVVNRYGKEALTTSLVKLLGDQQKDWYADLLLYELTRKEATNYLFFDNRGDWVKSQREKDIQMWRSLYN